MRAARSTLLSLFGLGLGLGTFVLACTLTTSLDGFTGGPAADADASTIDGSRVEGGDAAEGGPSMEGGSEAGAAAYRALVLSDKPLAYYRLGDNGDVAKDEVGGHDGTYVGAVKHVPGALAGDSNAAAVFDGTSSYVDVGDVLPFTGNAPFTIEAWASPESGGTEPMCVAAKTFAPGGVTGNVADGWSLYLDSPDYTIELARFAGGTAERTNGPALTKSKFNHLVTVYDGAAVAVWLDGVRVGTGTSGQALPATTKSLTIGAGRGGIYCYFRGALDEVALYGAALGDERIRAHYRAGSGK